MTAAKHEKQEVSEILTLEEARRKATEELATFARTFSLRAKKDPNLRIAFAELEEQLLRKLE